MWITLNEPQQAAHQGYRIGTHAPGKTDLALAAAATHHLLLAHGLAVEAIRAELSGHIPVGITIDLHPVRALDEDAATAAAALDAEQNRIFLEPVLHGSYPDVARAELLPPEELIEPGDMDRISAPLDFLGLNYYCPYYVRTGDWNDLRRGESPLAGYPGAVNYVPPDIPRTTMGWLIEPEGLYDALRTLDREAPRLPLYITENGCAADDYIDPDGRVNDFERVDYLEGHLDAARRAIDDGVNLAGYFVWSLTGQLRVGTRISASLRPVLRRFRHAASPAEEERGVLLRGGEVERAAASARRRPQRPSGGRGLRRGGLRRLGDRRLSVELPVATLERDQKGVDDRRVELGARAADQLLARARRRPPSAIRAVATMASYASATARMRASSGISCPPIPLG